MFHVKPSAHEITITAVAEALALVGIALPETQAAELVRHAQLVLEANDRLNLTRIVEPAQVIQLHIVDSLAYLPLVGRLDEPVLDLGSGAGFPGIPLAIVGHRVTLCESVKKKATFLQETAEDMGLSVQVAPERGEELAQRLPAHYGTVVVRALSALPSLLELASPPLKTNGRLIALKGSPEEAELAAAERVASVTGFELSCDEAYELPTGEKRRVIAYTKTRKASVALPRRPGMAQRQPLSGT